MGEKTGARKTFSKDDTKTGERTNEMREFFLFDPCFKE
jgi:hypothetical protein